jgi:hypothetical protein
VKLRNNVTLVQRSPKPGGGGGAMKKSSVLESHKLFKEGRENMSDDERSDRPSSHRTDDNVEKVRNLVHSDRSLCLSITAVEQTRQCQSETR